MAPGDEADHAQAAAHQPDWRADHGNNITLDPCARALQVADFHRGRAGRRIECRREEQIGARTAARVAFPAGEVCIFT